MASLVSLVLSCLLLLHLPPAATGDRLGQVCSTRKNYTTNSTFLSNLNHLLTSLTSNASLNSGSSTETIGRIPDQVSGLVLCRGDISATACSSCLTDASDDIVQLCRGSKDAIIWYDDCLLYYSYRNFLSSSNNSHRLIMWDNQNITNHSQFDKLVHKLMKTVADWAAYNTSRLFATGQVNSSENSTTIYALVQCTHDMSRRHCRQCLQVLIEYMPTYLYGKQEGWIFGVRCIAMYNVYSFFNGVPMVQVASPAAPALVLPARPPPSPPSSRRELGRKPPALGEPVVGTTPFHQEAIPWLEREGF